MNDKINIYLVGEADKHLSVNKDGDSLFGVFIAEEGKETRYEVLSSTEIFQLKMGDSPLTEKTANELNESIKAIDIADPKAVAAANELLNVDVLAAAEELKTELNEIVKTDGVKKIIEVPEEEIADEHDYAEASDAIKENTGKRKFYTGLGVGAAAMLGFGGLYHYLNRDKEEIKHDNLDDLRTDLNISELSVTEAIDQISNMDQRKFAQDIYKTFHEFYNQTHKDDNFRLEEDGEAYLTILPQELEALSLTLNDYSKILGDRYPDFISGFNQSETEMRANFLNAWQKLSVYYMNATEPSGISNLIRDPENRAFFEEMENAVLDFNNNPTQENSTEVWKNVYYNYIIAGSTGNYQSGSMQESVRANVAMLAYAAPQGIAMSHRNVPEMFVVKLDNVAEKERANVGDAFLQDGTEFLPLLENLEKDTVDFIIENEDTNKEYNQMDFGNISINEGVNQRGLCADVYSHISRVTREMDEYRNSNAIAARMTDENSKTILVQSLIRAGDIEISAHVNDADTLTEEMLNNLPVSREGRDAVEQYLSSQSLSGQNEVTYSDVRVKMTEEAYSYDVNKPASLIREGDKIQTSEAEAIVILTNNRFKNLEKDLDFENAKTGEKELIRETTETKKTGVISEKTTTETVQVEKDQLPPKLQEEATKQEDVILGEIAKDNTSAEAKEDAVDYSNSNRYDAKDKLAEFIPNSNLNYYSSQRYLAAYRGEKIDVYSDSQIKTAVEEDLSKYLDSLSSKEQSGLQSLYGDSWKSMISETYRTTWLNELSNITSIAYSDGITHGEELRRVNDKALEDAQKQVDELNKNAGIETEVTTPDTAPTVDAEAPSQIPTEKETVEEVTPEIDPNLGEQFQEDEVMIEEATAPAVEVTPSTETPVIEEPAQTVEVPGQDTGATPEQGGQEINADDQAQIDEMIRRQEEEAAKDLTEVNRPVDPIVTTSTNNLTFGDLIREQEIKAATAEAPVAVAEEPSAIDLDLSELGVIEEEVSEIEPVRTR